MKTFLAWIGGIVLFSALFGVLAGATLAGIQRSERERKAREETVVRIEQEGADAAKTGIPPTACPYEADKETWMKGWQRGFIESRKEPQ